MGSISRSPSSQSPVGNTPTSCRVFASFRSRDHSPYTNMSNWIECYNPSDNAWHHVTRVPGLIENHILKGFSMVAIGDSVFIIGGRLCHKVPGDDPDDTVEIDLEVRPHVLRYDVGEDMWFNCAPLRTPRFDFACTVCDNKIYVAGGQCTLASARGLSSAEVYDPMLDSWEALPNMSTLRYKCVAVTWQGKVHVIGGFAGRGGSWDTKERSSAEVFDPGHANWELKVGMWQLDVPPNQIVGANGKLFRSGDCLNAWKGRIEAYDEELNIWKVAEGSTYTNWLYWRSIYSLISPSVTTFPAISFPISSPSDQRLYITMAPVGTELYFLAGYRVQGETSRMRLVVHVFDIASNGVKWRSLAPMEEEEEKELCSHCCVAETERGEGCARIFMIPKLH